LTFLAICTLSWRIAIISWRLYFITGHWPVVKEWDLAQPSPIRIDSDPTLAGSSTAPGSPVTYSPGIPSLPAALVMSMTELSTVAGASPWEPSVPWPRASKPTQSTAASTSPDPPRICWSCSRRSSWADRSMVSQPKLAAWASRSLFMSPTMTTAAPSRWAEVALASPTGPAPAM
jgi:hypothetical protein